ncbi:Endoglucanase 1 [Chlorella sorokiniana]|uniref:Endoglucanase 1 n=1 Tax=Chlorella sorokiniana TaxID=3076 RepID=A0A2P6TXR2_CHLSO|nr:Endoglucanase 1 [Chlorella sorokiniana]|eukprot:PRW58855.1 Endoglucanase 1 [Chlorella sorokiniana]
MARPERGAAAARAATLLLCLGALLALAGPGAAKRTLAQGQANGSGAAPSDATSDPFASVEPTLGAEAPNATQPAADNVNKFGLAPGVGAPGGEPRLKFTGIATVAYEAQPMTPFGAAKLGCSLGFVSPTFQSNYVGVSSDLLQKGQACGRCIKLQCDDVSCQEPGKLELPAIVADVCGSCTKSDLSISAPLFRNLTGRDPGATPSIVVNSQRLVRSSAGWWDWNPGQPINPSAPLDVALQGGNKEVLRARVPALRNADLGVQFKAS